MDFRVTIQQADDPLTVEMGETILAAALRHGVNYPHGCQSGNCGACKSHLVAGEVEMSPYSEYALSPADRADGLILACRSVPWADCEVAWLELDESMTHPICRLVCTVTDVTAATHDTTIVRAAIERGGPFTFSAGQYLNVTFAGQPAREYSLANRPNDAPLEFHIRHVPGGAASGYVAGRLQVGESFAAEGPYGTSYLRELHNGPIIAIAGGSGLSPVLSIVRAALAKGMAQPIHLFFGVRDEHDVYCEAVLGALAAAHDNFDFEIVLSEPTAATKRPTGFVHERVARRFADFDGCKAYLAGPPPMVEAATELLADRAMGRRDIHADAFYTEADKAALEDAALAAAAALPGR